VKISRSGHVPSPGATGERPRGRKKWHFADFASADYRRALKNGERTRAQTDIDFYAVQVGLTVTDAAVRRGWSFFRRRFMAGRRRILC
jgi:hypothetical protein